METPVAAAERVLRLGVGHLDDAGRPRGRFRLPRWRRYVQGGARISDEARRYGNNLDHPCGRTTAIFRSGTTCAGSLCPRTEEASQLAEICGYRRVAAGPSRPLWEMWVIEGGARSDRGGDAQVHHAVVDGVAGASCCPCGLRPDAPAP